MNQNPSHLKRSDIPNVHPLFPCSEGEQNDLHDSLTDVSETAIDPVCAHEYPF